MWASQYIRGRVIAALTEGNYTTWSGQEIEIEAAVVETFVVGIDEAAGYVIAITGNNKLKAIKISDQSVTTLKSAGVQKPTDYLLRSQSIRGRYVAYLSHIDVNNEIQITKDGAVIKNVDIDTDFSRNYTPQTVLFSYSGLYFAFGHQVKTGVNGNICLYTGA